MRVWNVLHAARWKYKTQKSPFWHHRTTLSGYIFGTKACIDNWKKLVKHQYSSTCPDNKVNFGLLTAEICWRVWGTPANFNGFRVLAPLLHGTLVVGVSQSLRRWTEGATYIRQGGHHVGHWPTFLVCVNFSAVDCGSYCLLLDGTVFTGDAYRSVLCVIFTLFAFTKSHLDLYENHGLRVKNHNRLFKSPNWRWMKAPIHSHNYCVRWIWLWQTPFLLRSNHCYFSLMSNDQSSPFLITS